MCLSDNRLIRKVSVSTRPLATAIAATQVVGPSPYRVGLVVSSGVDAQSGGKVILGNDSGVDADNGYNVSIAPLDLNWRDHGPLCQLEWWAFDTLGGSEIWVAESILPAEWWPVFLGEVPFESVRGR